MDVTISIDDGIVKLSLQKKQKIPDSYEACNVPDGAHKQQHK